MNATGKRRLLKLADLLEADANNPKGIKFDIRMWGRTRDAEPDVSCGTTACAMGLAAISGAFKKAGLSYVTRRVWYDGNYATAIYITDINGCSGGLSSAMTIFDIDYDTAQWLFLPDSYTDSQKTGKRGERAVAKRIRNYVAGKANP